MFSLESGAAVVAAARQYAALFAGVAALCGLVTFLQTWLFNLAGSRLADRLRRLTFRNYLQQVGAARPRARRGEGRGGVTATARGSVTGAGVVRRGGERAGRAGRPPGHRLRRRAGSHRSVLHSVPVRFVRTVLLFVRVLAGQRFTL